ncbi:MAG: GNAT family N-acetyltransferase [Pseudomonadota bacterium]|nr:GNAT family N-acetyltransferase [Pseudomonadota bacterium]
MNQRTTNIQTASLSEAVLVHKAIPEMKDVNLSFFEERLKGKSYVCFVAYIEGAPVGYALRYDRYEDGSLYCWMGGVVPEGRRKGVMSHIMDETMSYAKENGYTSLKLKTTPRHTSMLKFLPADGWTLIPEGEKGCDKLLYEKPVI